MVLVPVLDSALVLSLVALAVASTVQELAGVQKLRVAFWPILRRALESLLAVLETLSLVQDWADAPSVLAAKILLVLGREVRPSVPVVHYDPHIWGVALAVSLMRDFVFFLLLAVAVA